MAKSKGKGLDKKLELSEELSEFMGKDYASRAEITKEIWKHIKAEDLQDPSNRRNIIPDEVLEPILGSKKITMFQIASKISDHVFSD